MRRALAMQSICNITSGVGRRQNVSTTIFFVANAFDVAVLHQLGYLPAHSRRVGVHQGSQLARSHRSVAYQPEQTDERGTFDASGFGGQLSKLAITNSLQPHELSTELLGCVDVGLHTHVSCH